MIQFSRLRLSGFKSFVERTELDIGAGLNGVVGPNGCGKSNLVEALRWVMGENSARRMRGDGMEDVIFAGTDKRSARNIAEVSLLLDNTKRQAPAQYNAHDDIEVVRRIERDQGSAYKINGKNVRARDVQMLFADTVTGSNSPALVSQGHVTRMINAKPHDRRLVLEESAGISGLYARRHEAELRLKAADANLVRVEDILGSMETRLSALKRQARQAGRYRNINAQIRQMELIVTYLEWQALSDRHKEKNGAFAAIESVVAEKLSAVTQLTKTQSTQVEDLPPLRKKEAELAAALQSRKIALQRFEDERQRHAEALNQAKEQLSHAREASAHEQQSLEESTKLLERILEEQKEILEQSAHEDEKITEKGALRENLEKEVIALEERYTALKENAAESRARQKALEDQIVGHESRIGTLESRKEKAQNEREDLAIAPDHQTQIDELVARIAALEEKRETLNAKTDSAQDSIRATEEYADAMRRVFSDAERELASFRTEIATLETFFRKGDAHNFAPVLDKITTKPGFEKALSRALGDSLMASLDTQAPSRWVQRSASASPSLPPGVQSLLPCIDAPEELAAALSQVGYLEDSAQGEILAPALQAGQSLVSADGTYWRWDGFTVGAEATDMHSVHLAQRNKLRELEDARAGIEEKAEQARKNRDDALAKQKQAKDDHQAILADIRQTEKTLAELRPALARIREKEIRLTNDRARLDDLIRTAEEDMTQIRDALDKDRYTLQVLLDHHEKSEDSTVSEVKNDLDDKREIYQEALKESERLIQQQSTRRARLQAIADERVSLQNRAIRAREHLKSLTERTEVLTQRYEELKKQPRNFEKGQEDLLGQIEELDRERYRAAERLNESESELAQTAKALKEAERTLGDAREERARTQATLAALGEQLADMERAIQERLEIRPQELAQHSAVDLVKHTTQDLDALKQQREKLTRERDDMGAVNLRADEEAQELESELTGLLHERGDLVQAIEELRGGIHKINKEARERLLVAFEHVNAHFQSLFTKLFGGGKAHLALIDADDPLGAGLEIFAQPPGKALQSLSLLSGGEQTLASIALIFAMFLTNPSPICVLDEIDAPLDDANVDRVCDLLEEIAERGETRFLVITHHRLTMARMHRLYGVTMAEKGVSQLVSVDLQQSFDFIDQQAA